MPVAAASSTSAGCQRATASAGPRNAARSSVEGPRPAAAAQRDVAERRDAAGPALELRPQVGGIEPVDAVGEVIVDLARERAVARGDRDERRRIARRLERAAAAGADPRDHLAEIADPG